MIDETQGHWEGRGYFAHSDPFVIEGEPEKVVRVTTRALHCLVHIPCASPPPRDSELGLVICFGTKVYRPQLEAGQVLAHEHRHKKKTGPDPWRR